jgi:diguanylate cyclase (GGDEF)-like protein
MARIIVADDSELVRRMFERLLGEAGHEVDAVGDGHAAVEAALTGLYNHRHCTEEMEDEFERATRYGTPLSLLMIDLDHFKTFNDENGHLAGDAALKTVGRILSEALRAVDTLGRYGGEEFVAVLPQTGEDAARRTAERLRRIVESHDFGAGPSPRRITASIGVACHPGCGARSALELLKQADLALYRAKEAGRNRVE